MISSARARSDITTVLWGTTAAVDPPHPQSIAVVVGAKSEIPEVTLDALRELYIRRRRV